MVTLGASIGHQLAGATNVELQNVLDATEGLEEDPAIDPPISSANPEPITEETFNRWMASEPISEAVTHGLRQVLVGSLLDPRLRVQGTLVLDIEQDGEFYIASCDQFDEYGYGTDVITAVQDVRNSMAELYWELRENSDRLGSDLERIWQALSAQIYVA